MSSGAGLNRVFRNLLVLTPAATAVANPLAGYGTIGVNDTGMIMNDAMNFTKFTFMFSGSDAYSVTIYATADKRAYDLWRYNLNPNPYLPQWQGTAPTLPASAWVVCPGPSQQGGEGGVANPLTATNPTFVAGNSWLAFRAVLTTIGTPTTQVTLTVDAVP